MIDRINLILKAKNITARQFAEEIGIQPSGMSHIMSGRNRPSLDFVMKVINRYPEIDIKWLTLGEGQMYAPSMTAVPASSSRAATTSPSTSSAAWHVPPAPAPVSTSPSPMSQELDLFSSMDNPSEPLPNPSVHNDNERPVADFVPENTPVAAKSVPPAVVVDHTVEAVRPERENVRPESSSADAREADRPSQTQLNENRIDDIAPIIVAEKQNLAKKKIVKVVILYNDHSFSEYYPE